MAAAVGTWILSRPRELVIDSSEATITMRSPIHDRRFSFSEISHIELQPSQPPLTVPGLPTFKEDRFDVVLCIGRSLQLAAHHDLELPAARAEAQRLAKVTGEPKPRV